jgi:hypothetical protein
MFAPTCGLADLPGQVTDRYCKIDGDLRDR